MNGTIRFNADFMGIFDGEITNHLMVESRKRFGWRDKTGKKPLTSSQKRVWVYRIPNNKPNWGCFPSVYATFIQYSLLYTWWVLVSQGAAERVFGHSWAKPQRVAGAVRVWVNRCFSSMFSSETALLDNAGQASVINISFLLDVGIFHLPRLCLCYISEVWSAWRCPHDIELYHVNIMNTTWRLFFNYIAYECYMNITYIFCTTHDMISQLLVERVSCWDVSVDLPLRWPWWARGRKGMAQGVVRFSDVIGVGKDIVIFIYTFTYAYTKPY